MLSLEIPSNFPSRAELCLFSLWTAINHGCVTFHFHASICRVRESKGIILLRQEYISLSRSRSASESASKQFQEQVSSLTTMVLRNLSGSYGAEEARSYSLVGTDGDFGRTKLLQRPRARVASTEILMQDSSFPTALGRLTERNAASYYLARSVIRACATMDIGRDFGEKPRKLA